MGRRELHSVLEQNYAEIDRLSRKWDETWRKVEAAVQEGWPRDPLTVSRAVARRVAALGEDGEPRG